MKISESAWHYGLYRMGFENGYASQTANLCSYFWRTVAGGLKALCIVGFLLAILIGAGMVVFQNPWWSLGAAALVAVFILYMEYGSPLFHSVFDDGGKKKPREKGLLRSYIQAKKDKHCPLIEFVE
jgi:hypothetical protein